MSERGTGITTRQMVHAAKDAVYIWPNDYTRYAHALASYLNRSDLKIRGLYYLIDLKFLEEQQTDIILDHAVRLTVYEFDLYQRAKTRIFYNIIER